METYPTSKQRAALLEFSAALGSADNALRRDECNDWRIGGSRGHVYAVPGLVTSPSTPGFQIFISTRSKQAWTWAKKAFAFAMVTLDCDDEGVLFLDRLPTVEEAALIRLVAGIRKRQELSPEAAAAAQARGKQLHEKLLAARAKQEA